MKSILIIIIAIIFIFGCEKSLEPTDRDLDLSGVWKESFHTFYYEQITYQENYSGIVELDRVTSLEFKNSKFYVQTLPHIPNLFGVFDTSYSGHYSILLDTLCLELDNFDKIEKMIFKLQDEELTLEMVTHMVSDSIYAIELSSFVWGGSFGKRAGVFKKLK